MKFQWILYLCLVFSILSVVGDIKFYNKVNLDMIFIMLLLSAYIFFNNTKQKDKTLNQKERKR